MGVGEDLSALGEELDFLVRAQDEADVPIFLGGLAVCLEDAGAEGSFDDVCAWDTTGEAGDIDDAAEHARAVDLEEGADTVAQSVEAFQAGQFDVVGQGVGRGGGQRGCIGLFSQQEGACGDAAVFVGGKGGDTEGLDRGGDAARVRAR